MSSIESADVARAFEAYPAKFRRKLMRLRRLILETAKRMEGVGEIEERKSPAISGRSDIDNGQG